MSRSKGVRGELEACEALAGIIPGLKRSYHQSRSGDDAPDIDCPGCKWWIEVKRAERVNLVKALGQASGAAHMADLLAGGTGLTARPGVVAFRGNHEQWGVAFYLADWERVVGR